MSVSGSIRQLTLDNVNYRVAPDSDFSRTLGQYSKEIQATSGTPNIKITKQPEMIEGVDIVADGADRENLRDLINRLTAFDIAYVTANGDTYTTSGQITSTGDVTQDAKITISILPETEWTAIVV